MGYRTIEEMKAAMTFDEFKEWLWYIRINPSVGQRLDYHFALLRCQIAGMFAKTPPKPKDFLIDWAKEAVDQVDPKKLTLRELASIMPGAILKEKKRDTDGDSSKS